MTIRSKSEYRRMAAQRRDRYVCYGCKTEHTTDNMVCYCASCYDRLRLENEKLNKEIGRLKEIEWRMKGLEK